MVTHHLQRLLQLTFATEEITLLSGEDKVQDSLVETWFEYAQSNLPATVAPGGISVKLNDPYIADTKNNRQLTLQNTEELTIHPHPKCWKQLCSDA